jgi:hypothetical protein
MTENKALYIEQMLRKFVIPHLKKKMNTTEEITSILEAHNITKIDSMYLPQEAIKRFNKQGAQKVLKYLETDDANDVPTPYDPQQGEAEVQKEMAPLGNQRFFKPSEIPTVTWEEALKDLEWELEVDISGESTDKNTVLTTLNTALATVANPNFQNNPTAQLIIGKILTKTGEISPLELSTLPPPQQMPLQPVTQ